MSKTPDAPVPPTASNDAPPVPYRQLFRFADTVDYVVLFVGSLCAIVNGVTLPAFAILMGTLFDKVNEISGFMDAVSDLAIAFISVGGISFLVSLGEMTAMNISASRQIRRVRTKYFEALMRQDVGWYDMNTAGDLASRLAENTIQMYNGMGQKLGNTLHNVGTFFAGMGVGFYYNWKLTLVILSFTPVLGAGAGWFKSSSEKYEAMMKRAYSAAATIATNALTAVRTVTAFGGQRIEVEKYARALVAAEKAGERKARSTGIAMGVMYFMVFMIYGVGLWYGAKLIADSNEAHPGCPMSGSNCFSAGQVWQVFFAVILGAMSIGQAGPNFAAFVTAQAAAARIFQIIDRVPDIDIASKVGTTLDPKLVKGAISFKNVSFAYPSRPNQLILNNLTFDIRAGETVAFVGESGSGKSTVLQLLQRFYDPQSGCVELDGVPITGVTVKSLRDCMGIVSQEPALFDVSIGENIALGALGDAAATTAADIKRAAELASASEFIEKLQEGYNTVVGERGAQLSGGQKQRIAIARAVMRNPSIFLLDEATSALDSRSEREVQAALDKLMVQGKAEAAARTTVMIAHRLSTVAHVDRIFVLQKGSVVEMGSPAELEAMPNGYFKRLLEMQNVASLAKQDSVRSVVDVTIPEGAGESKESQPVSATSTAVASIPKASSGKKGDSSGRGATVQATTASDAEAGTTVPVAAAPGTIEEKDVPFMRIWKYQRDEYPILAVSFLVALTNGAIFPCFAIIFSSLIRTMYNPVVSELRHDALFWMGMLFVIAGAAGIGYFLQPWLFGKAGERLTRKLRVEAFQSLLNQDMAFYDNPKNTVGALATRLSADAALVQATTGPKLGQQIQNNCALLAGFAIALWSSWMLTLVISGIVPFMAFAGMMVMKFVQGNDNDTSFRDAGTIASEAVASIRTVQAFNLQGKLQERFQGALQAGIREGYLSHWASGSLFGLSSLMMFGSYALCFWAGGKFISQKHITFEEMLRAFMALALSAWNIGENSQMAADQGKANAAKVSLFGILDKQSAIDPTAEAGMKPPACNGDIEFRDVSFAYPSRPNITVLKHASFRINAGQLVGFVGASGCGKSTIVRLLLRYYDVTSGEITLDGVPIKQLNVAWLRQQFGLVSQEPDLFPDSLEYNILYGDPAADLNGVVQVQRDEHAGESGDAKSGAGPSDAASRHCRSATEVPASVVEAALAANAAAFIDGFSDKYGTRAGEMGSQLSGGQKQRIAIARAIIRHPHVLLLDEATSALDSESEVIVQKALDGLVSKFHGTTLVIAHRLSTIRNADVIVVLHDGEVVQMGTHDALMTDTGGRYAKLIEAQQVHTASVV